MKKSNLKFLKVRAFWVITHYTHTHSQLERDETYVQK